jgi:tRNA pseudouridine38-40 synthase
MIFMICVIKMIKRYPDFPFPLKIWYDTQPYLVMNNHLNYDFYDLCD